MPAVTHAVIVAASTLFAGSHGVELDKSVLHAMHTPPLQSASGQSPTITADEDMPANTDISSLSLTPTVVSEGIKPFKGGPQVGIVLASSGPTNVLLPADRLSEFRFTDTRNGGWLSQNPYWRGNINFGISNQSGSRSELRRNEQINGWQVMGGKFTLISEASNADRLNIIQVLTLEGAGATQGSAKPNEQLAIRKTGRFVGNRPVPAIALISRLPRDGRAKHATAARRNLWALTELARLVGISMENWEFMPHATAGVLLR